MAATHGEMSFSVRGTDALYELEFGFFIFGYFERQRLCKAHGSRIGGEPRHSQWQGAFYPSGPIAVGLPSQISGHRSQRAQPRDARGRCRPREMDRATLAMAMAAMSDRNAVAADVARRLGMTSRTSMLMSTATAPPRRRDRRCWMACRSARRAQEHPHDGACVDDLSSGPLEPPAPRLWPAVAVRVPDAGAEEQARRQEAVDFARSSVRLEGFRLSPNVEATSHRFIRGAIDRDTMMAEIRALFRALNSGRAAPVLQMWSKGYPALEPSPLFFFIMMKKPRRGVRTKADAPASSGKLRVELWPARPIRP